MLTEENIVDSIEVLASGHIQVRVANRIMKDGALISQTYHRHVVEPGADLSNEDPKVQAIARAAWGEAE